MTEYWVSQGNKWCDFCKIYIANNPLSIRTHELGTRHKDSVAKRLATMQKESATKEKQQKEAERVFEQIEAKAKHSYQKDLKSFGDTVKASNFPPGLREGWEFDAASGYYYNLAKGYHYDSNSGLFYSPNLGKWITEEEAFKSSQVSKPKVDSQTSASQDNASKPKGGADPGSVISASLNPMRSVKGAPSSIDVKKRKRSDGKTRVISKEEADALKAREAAKKRVEEREKPLLGLYKSYK